MARKYKVEGTKDFLIWSVILLGLGLWCVRDGWFPPESVLKKHPQAVPASFQVAGTVSDILVAPEDEVREQQPMMRLARATQRTAKEEAEAVFTRRTNEMERVSQALDAAVTGAASTNDLERFRRQAQAQQAAVDAARELLAKAMEQFEARELRAPTGGVVRAVLVASDDPVIAGQRVATIDPGDHFYAFNKSLALISLIGAAICAYIHRVVH